MVWCILIWIGFFTGGGFGELYAPQTRGAIFSLEGWIGVFRTGVGIRVKIDPIAEDTIYKDSVWLFCLSFNTQATFFVLFYPEYN